MKRETTIWRGVWFGLRARVIMARRTKFVPPAKSVGVDMINFFEFSSLKKGWDR